MSTIKSYTDIKQSKKLANILQIGSADMCYPPYYIGDEDGDHLYYSLPLLEHKDECAYNRDNKDEYIPCWSLSALLDVIPQEIFDGEYIINITEGKDYKWIITYDHYEKRNHSFFGLSTGADNLIDACYELILKLHVLKM